MKVLAISEMDFPSLMSLFGEVELFLVQLFGLSEANAAFFWRPYGRLSKPDDRLPLVTAMLGLPHGGVTEQKLDLFEVSAVLAAEFRAGAAQIVGPETLDTDGFGGGFNYTPDRPIAQFLSHDAPTFGDRPE